MDILNWLCNWYKKNCNGDWEHNYGVAIGTLDNPGWSVKIDLVDTPLYGKKLEKRWIENSDSDWCSVSSDGIFFEAYGDSSKLRFMLEYFKEFVEE